MRLVQKKVQHWVSTETKMPQKVSYHCAAPKRFLSDGFKEQKPAAQRHHKPPSTPVFVVAKKRIGFFVWAVGTDARALLIIRQ